jgi:hypothetical protein
MRKFLLAIAALLGLADAAHAAYFQAQTYLPSGVTRTQKNLVTDYGGVCDAQAVTRTVTLNGTGNTGI